jgi:hypothetical protein
LYSQRTVFGEKKGCAKPWRLSPFVQAGIHRVIHSAFSQRLSFYAGNAVREIELAAPIRRTPGNLRFSKKHHCLFDGPARTQAARVFLF